MLTDYFVASNTEFHQVFRGWKHAPPLLDEPVRKNGINPFTQQPMSFMSRTVSPPPADPGATVNPDISSLQRIDCTGFADQPLAKTAALLEVWPPDRAEEEVLGRMLSGPPETSLVVLAIADELTAALAETTDDGARRLASALEEEDEDEYGSSATDYLEILSSIIALAKHARATDRRMYMAMSP